MENKPTDQELKDKENRKKSLSEIMGAYNNLLGAINKELTKKGLSKMDKARLELEKVKDVEPKIYFYAKKLKALR